MKAEGRWTKVPGWKAYGLRLKVEGGVVKLRLKYRVEVEVEVEA